MKLHSKFGNWSVESDAIGMTCNVFGARALERKMSALDFTLMYGPRSLRRATARIFREDARPPDVDVLDYLKTTHSAFIEDDPTFRVFVYIEEYNLALILFDFDTRVLTNMSLHEVLDIVRCGLREDQLRNSFLKTTTVIAPNMFALEAHHKNLGSDAPPPYRFPARAYHLIFAYMRTENPVELQLSPFSDEAKKLLNNLVKEGLFTQTCATQLPLPGFLPKMKAPSHFPSFPVCTFAMLQCFPPRRLSSPPAIALRRAAWTQGATNPRMLYLKFYDFPCPDSRTCFPIADRSHKVIGARVDDRLRKHVELHHGNSIDGVTLVLKNTDEAAVASFFSHPLLQNMNFVNTSFMWVADALGLNPTDRAKLYQNVFVCQIYS